MRLFFNIESAGAGIASARVWFPRVVFPVVDIILGRTLAPHGRRFWVGIRVLGTL